MLSHHSLHNFSFQQNPESPKKLSPLMMNQPQQFNSPLQRMPSMNSIGSSYPGNTHPRHPPLLQSPTRYHDQSYSHHPHMRRELSLDIRATNNPLLENLTPKISTKAGAWNQINIQDSFVSAQSPTQRFIRHQPSLTSSIPNGRPQYMDMRPQLPLRAAQEQSPYTFGYGIEAQMEKQNRMLSQLMGAIAKQELAEKHRMQMDMNQKMKELEIDRLKVEIELEKQRVKRQQTIEEMAKKTTENNVSPQRKEASSLEKVVMSLLVKKSSSLGRNAQLMERIGSLPLISERQYGEQDEFIEDQDEEEVVKPQKSARKRVVISRSSLLRKEPTAIIKLQSQPVKSSDPVEISGSLDYLNDISPSQKSPKKKTQSSKKSLDDSTTPKSSISGGEGRFSRAVSFIENEGSSSPKKRKSKKDRTTRKSDEKESTITVINEEELVEKILQNEKKKKAQSKLRNVAWLLVYPRILYAARKKHMMDDREAFEMAVSSNMGQIYELSKVFIQDCAGKEILKMLTDSSFSYSLANLSASQGKKSEKMCAALTTHLKQIFNKLIVNIGNIPSVLLHLLAPLIQEEGFLQNDYFSQFEINRMKFGPFGNLKEMNPQRAKLIIGGVILMRVLIYYFIMRPWEMFKQDKSKFKTEKLLNIGSVLYNAIVAIFKTSVPAYPNNQSFLSVELKIKPKKNIQQAIDGHEAENAVKADKEGNKDGDIIQGFYTTQQLASFFESNKKIADELKQVISGCLDVLYEKISEVKVLV